jgi:hypothetical protein
MTQERFIKLLDNPAEVLAGITYEELKTLTLAYPYAHNLRTLLALKARQDDHPEASRALGAAAAYSLDRTRLFLLIHPTQVVVPQQVEAELILELKPIETVQRRLESLETLDRVEPTEEVTITQAIDIPEQSEPTPITTTAVASIPMEMPAPVPTSELVVPTLVATPSFVSFQDWLGAFQVPTLQETTKVNTTLKPHTIAIAAPESIAPAKPASVAQVLAEKSVAENKDVISETLAKLLARQGNKDKAIAMYERLCLVFPEKSATFAAEIEKLK